MLTKKDLAAIQEMLNNSEARIKTETKTGIISEVRKMIQENTDSLVELITTGFHMQDAGFKKTDALLDNHEQRIGTLERKYC